MLNIANEFIKSVGFVDYLPNIDPKYVELTFVVGDHSNKPSDSYFEENFKRIFFQYDANAIINSDLYRKIRDRVTNSIIASAIVSNVSSATKSLNVFVAYTLHLIKLSGNKFRGFNKNRRLNHNYTKRDISPSTSQRHFKRDAQGRTGTTEKSLL